MSELQEKLAQIQQTQEKADQEKTQENERLAALAERGELPAERERVQAELTQTEDVERQTQQYIEQRADNLTPTVRAELTILMDEIHGRISRLKATAELINSHIDNVDTRSLEQGAVIETTEEVEEFVPPTIPEQPVENAEQKELSMKQVAESLAAHIRSTLEEARKKDIYGGTMDVYHSQLSQEDAGTQAIGEAVKDESKLAELQNELKSLLKNDQASLNSKGVESISYLIEGNGVNLWTNQSVEKTLPPGDTERGGTKNTERKGSNIDPNLERLRKGETISLSVDYQNGVLVEDSSKPRLMVLSENGGNLEMRPSVKSFQMSREYTENYEKYFMMSPVDSGPIEVVQPAKVEWDSHGGGYKLVSKGVLRAGR